MEYRSHIGLVGKVMLEQSIIWSVSAGDIRKERECSALGSGSGKEANKA